MNTLMTKKQMRTVAYLIAVMIFLSSTSMSAAAASSISLSKSKTCTLYVGAKIKVTATTNIKSFKVSNTKVKVTKISKKVLVVKAVKVGTTTVTVKTAKKSYTLKIKVKSVIATTVPEATSTSLPVATTTPVVSEIPTSTVVPVTTVAPTATPLPIINTAKIFHSLMSTNVMNTVFPATDGSVFGVYNINGYAALGNSSPLDITELEISTQLWSDHIYFPTSNNPTTPGGVTTFVRDLNNPVTEAAVDCIPAHTILVTNVKWEDANGFYLWHYTFDGDISKYLEY